VKIEQVKLDALIPYARNSRTHSDAQVAQIAASIKEFGFTNPVLIDETGSIIAGHGRVMAARKLAIADVPSIRLTHLTEAQKKAYVIADNKLALNAGWDDEMLAVELTDLKDMGFDLDLTGFSTDEIEALLAPVGTEGLTDEDAVPEVPEAPVTVLGDVWLLGKHRVMCGDSTSIDAVEKLMDGGRAQFCFTSPPYADQREYNGSKELSTQHLATFIRTSKGFCNFFAVNLGLSRKSGEINTYWEDYILEARQCGLKLVSWNIWDRSGEGGSIGNMTAPFPINHEWIFVFADELPDINRTIPNKHGGKGVSGTIRGADSEFSERKSVVHEFGKLGTVLKCGVQRGKNEHPAMFPVELPQNYIEACSKNGSTVYEPFGGSGTTLIACEKTSRIACLMELDPKYCDVIVQRWQEFTGQTATLESNGKPFISLKKAA
jgi:DNA modification methylase